MPVKRSSRDEPLLEREAELDALIGLARRASSGAGGVALVEGPAGIGKTALLERAVEGIRNEGTIVSVARGGELERDLPWGVVRDLFERLLGRFAPGEREMLFAGAAGLARGALYSEAAQPAAGDGEALATALHGLYWLTAAVAERGPVVVVVDDAHWADPSSLRFLRYLAARVNELPVAIIATVRSGEPEASGHTVAELASHPWTIRLQPSPLSEAAAREIIAATLGQPAGDLGRTCHELTAGNPFYLRELLRDLPRATTGRDPTDPGAIEELRPTSIARMLQHRLARLPGKALELARAIAVLGPRTSVGAAARLAEVPTEDAARTADALVAAEVLRPELPLEFVHPLVRRVLYWDTPPAERSVRHARAAELLAAAGAEPADVAAHLLATEPAGDPATVTMLVAAARDAAGRGAPDAAVAYLRRALDEPPPEDQAAELLWQLGRAEAAIAGESALPTLERALALAQDAAKRAEIALEMSLILRISSEFPRALAILEPTLAELPPGSPLSERVEGELINVAMLSGQSGARTAFERLARFVDPAERQRVRDARLLAGIAAAAVGANQPADVAAELAERALAAISTGDAEPSVVIYVADVLAYCDRFATARRAAEELAAQGIARGSAITYGFALAALSRIGYREGRIREAEADVRRCMEIYQDWPADPLDPLSFLVDALIERGELDEAERIIQTVPLEGREGGWDALILRGSRGRLRLAQGDARAALDDLLHCGHRLVGVGAVNPTLMAWRSSCALAHLALGSRDQALEVAEEELGLARSFGAARAVGIALRSLGLARGPRGGIELLEESVAVLDGSGARLEHARSLCELGAALRRAGRRGAAREPLREALDLAVRCGGDALAGRAREELSAAGARPRRDRLHGRDALTVSELRVAKLAASGATNREIAQALFLTMRTVETHLTHAYRKLDIGSRDQVEKALEAEPSPKGGATRASPSM
jgi:DNA-binding CsgD family transcriptional regulator